MLSVVAGVCAVLAGGCIVPQEPEEPLATRAEVAYLRGELQRLRAQQEASAGEMGQLRGDLYSATAHQPGYASQAQVQALEARVDALQAQLQQETAARSKGEKQIYDDIVRKVTEISKKQAASASAGNRSYGSGWEHEVQAGQSLSVIAAAYKTTVEKIMKANNLKNPNSLRVGQKLFIPDN